MLLKHFTPLPGQRAFHSTSFCHFSSLITEIHLSSGAETFYFQIDQKMPTMEDLSIQPYMFKPKSDPEREKIEDDEPAEPRLQMNALQMCVYCIYTFLTPCLVILMWSAVLLHYPCICNKYLT
ncbi:hypothetical protein ILYODFUR_004228 [Ilyodon furcidens]|uniref:Uncharacterized protein n=1 Tax=Ilyodon furcidens TaxID=33524 RepID=A0ABV0T5B3_9TELE